MSVSEVPRDISLLMTVAAELETVVGAALQTNGRGRRKC
jgi:hypothetical protein